MTFVLEDINLLSLYTAACMPMIEMTVAMAISTEMRATDLEYQDSRQGLAEGKRSV